MRIASSMKSRYGMGGLFPSMPHEAVRMATGREASMRWARAPEAKPPKTTAWMAPRRLMARMPISAAGIMGTEKGKIVNRVARQGSLTVDKHDIPLLDTLLPQDGSEDLDLIEQLLVCDALLGVGDGAVVKNGGEVTVAGKDMSVNTVVARRYLAIGEPLPVLVSVARLEPLGCAG